MRKTSIKLGNADRKQWVMLDLLERIAVYLTDPRGPVACAVATVISATGSAPRSVGTSMLVSESGVVTGSLSGGCVEGAVFEACQEVIATGIPVRERYGVSDDGLAPGLPCGGSVDVLIQPIFPAGRSPVRRLNTEAMASAVSGAETAALVCVSMKRGSQRLLRHKPANKQAWWKIYPSPSGPTTPPGGIVRAAR